MKLFKKIICLTLAVSMLMIPVAAKAAGDDLQVDASGNCTFTLSGAPANTNIEIYYYENVSGTPVMDSSGNGTTSTGVLSATKQTDDNGSLSFSFSVTNSCLAELFYTDNNLTSGYLNYTYTATPTSTATPEPTATVTPEPTATPNIPSLAFATTATSNTVPTEWCVGDTADLNSYYGTDYTVMNVYTDSTTSSYVSFTSTSGTYLDTVTVEKAEFEGKSLNLYIDVKDGTTQTTDTIAITVYGKLDTTKGLTIQDNHPSYRTYTAGETLDVTDLDSYVYMTLDSTSGSTIMNLKDKMTASSTSSFFTYSPSLTTELTTDVTQATCTFTYPDGLTASTTSVQGTFDITVSSSSGITISTCTGTVGDTVNLISLINPIEAQKDCTITLKDQMMSKVDNNGNYLLEKAGTSTFEVKRKNSDAVTGTVTINPQVSSFTITTQPTLSYQEGEYFSPTGMTASAVITTEVGGSTTTKTDFDLSTDFTYTPTTSTALTIADHNGNPVTVKYGDATATTNALTVTTLTSLAKPTIQATGSKTDKTRTVSMSCTNGRGTILYTTDGTDPKSSSTYKQYTGAFDVTSSTTIKAYVMATNSSSQTIKSEVETITVTVSEKKGIVYNCSSYVNVRYGPGTSYAKLGKARKGEIYSITGESGTWYEIDYNGTTGYISKSYMKITSGGGSLSGTGTIVNCKHKVNVRKGPSSSTTRLGYAYLGETYNLLELTYDSSGREWYRIQYGTTTNAYIYGKYIQTSATPTPITAKTVKVTNCSNWVNVRKGPSTSYAKAGRAYLGATYDLLDWYAGNGFAKITYVYSDSSTGPAYISTKYLTTVD